MRAEMAEQPAVLGRLLSRRAEIVADVASVLPRPLHGVILLGRGSSENVAVYARYVLEMVLGVPAALGALSIATLYHADVDVSGHLVIGISQSGRTPDVVSAMGRMRAHGARTVALVNSAACPLAEVADVVIELGAGPERAIPATKTVTASLAAIAMLAAGLQGGDALTAHLESLPNVVATLLHDTSPTDTVAAGLDGAHHLLATGRGPLLAAALETALKIRETSGVVAEAISAAELRHGPIHAVGRGDPVLVFASPRSAAQMRSLQVSLERRGASVTVVGTGSSAAVPLPRDLDETLLAIPAVVRGQQLALALAQRRSLNADRPSGLTKVTMTA